MKHLHSTLFIAGTFLLGIASLGVAVRIAPHRIPALWRIPYTRSELGRGIDTATTTALDHLRSCTGRRFRLRSGWRSAEANRRVGSAANSVHLRGRAVDLKVPHALRDRVYRCARDAGFTGYGWGSTSVHLDLGRPRWWTYDDRGRPLRGAAALAHLHKAPATFRRDHGL